MLVQLAPTASGLEQVDAVLENEAAPDPVMVVDAVKLTAADVLFLSVTTCAAAVDPTVVDGNVREDGVIVTPVLVEVPVPETATVCGVEEAESLNVMVAVNVPAEAGVNVKVLVQLAPAASGLEQVDAVLENELAPDPVMVVDAVKVTAADVLFLSVTTCAAAVDPTAVDGNVRDDGVMVRPVLALVPVPDSATSCGDPVALSAIESDAVSEPAAAGLNSTEIVQLADAASDVVQVVADCRKELAFVPVNPIVPSVTAEALVFFTVTTCAAVVEPTVVEANVSVVGDTVTVRAAAVPVPVRATVWGEPEALSVNTSDAVRVPAAPGSKFTETVQDAPAAMGDGQFCEGMAKSFASVPLKPIDVKVADVVPVFLTVTLWLAEMTPTVVEGNVRLVGLKVNVGAAAPVKPLTRLVTFIEPRPVAWSYPLPAL